MSLLALQRLQTVVDQLAEQAARVDKKNAHTKAHRLLTDNALFSDDLFVTYSDKFMPYIDEINRKIHELNRLIDKNKKEFAFNQLPLVERQISSLVTALNANKSMHVEAQYRLNAFKSKRFKKAAQSVMQSSHELHQKLAETREFERRLAQMITDREHQRTQNSQSVAQQNLTKEILALHQRIGRCRQAISKIERQIELSEKRYTR
ncbi:primosomal replication protein PriC [Thalassotalea sp. PLHSN55]|uniref:primosomal replication protein PriC n=1 Tax=Thalassotalea sp. PLHSN55 TaxID=3435888 RepID=UPI003F86CD1B